MGKKKRGRRPQPVNPPKDDGNTIRIRREDLPKQRGVPLPAGRRFHNRSQDVKKGRRRYPKHKGRHED